MSKQNKWAGNMGKVASGGSGTKGGNTYSAPKAGAAPRASSSVSDNVIKMKTGPGDNMGMGAVSSHNSINAFTRGIKSRGPYGGPTFESLNNTKQTYQTGNTSSVSHFTTPSGGSSSRGITGGSGKGMTSVSKKVGSGSAKMTTRQSSPKSNKDGSGHMASVGK